MRLTMLLMLAGCSTPESFGERYENAFCEAMIACGGYNPDTFDDEYESACNGYLAGTWTEDRCPDWQPNDEREQACIDALGTCGDRAACDRDLFGCE